MHRVNRRGAAAIVAGLAMAGIFAGCSSSASAGDGLVGSWMNDVTQFNATSRSIVYVQPCLHAEFAPVTLDANRDFTVNSTALTIVGNIRTSPDTYLELKGHFIGNNLQLQSRLVQLPDAVADPVVVLLTPGELKSVLVCTA